MIDKINRRLEDLEQPYQPFREERGEKGELQRPKIGENASEFGQEFFESSREVQPPPPFPAVFILHRLFFSPAFSLVPLSFSLLSSILSFF